MVLLLKQMPAVSNLLKTNGATMQVIPSNQAIEIMKEQGYISPDHAPSYGIYPKKFTPYVIWRSGLPQWQYAIYHPNGTHTTKTEIFNTIIISNGTARCLLLQFNTPPTK